MNGPEHYRAAEAAVEESRRCVTAGVARMWLIKAGVHAQLAHTAAMIGLADEDENRAWREVIVPAALREAAGQPPGGLVPADTCGSWTGGRRCVLRPGHDEPCLPYRIPAGDAPRCPAVSQVTRERCWHAAGHAGEHRSASAGGTYGWHDAPGPDPREAAPAGPASRDDGDPGMVLP